MPVNDSFPLFLHSYFFHSTFIFRLPFHTTCRYRTLLHKFNFKPLEATHQAKQWQYGLKHCRSGSRATYGDPGEMAERIILRQDGGEENSLRSSEGKQNLLFAKLLQLVCRDMPTCGGGLSGVKPGCKSVMQEQKKLKSNLLCL